MKNILAYEIRVDYRMQLSIKASFLIFFLSLIALVYCKSLSIYTSLPLSHGPTAKPPRPSDNGTIPPLDCDSDGRPDPRAYSESTPMPP